MPGKMVQCTIYSKNMRSDNLRRHARSCKRANSCRRDDKSSDDGLILDYISGAGDHHKTERVSNTDSTDEETTSSEAEYSESSNGDDAICPDVDHIGLWERLAIICIIHNNSKLKPLHIFKGYVSIYMRSESDELFNEIMNDIMDAKLRDVPLRDAIRNAVKENEESIIASVEMCPNDDSVWCQLGKLGGDWDCQFLTGEPCHCIECDGVSILNMMVFFMTIFFDMREDSLIQQIEDDIDEIGEDSELDDKVNQVVDKYRDDILDKLNNAKKMLKECGWSYLCFI